jgi:hypothetical protein
MKKDIITELDLKMDIFRKAQERKAKKMIKKARAKSNDRRNVWDEYTGLFELMDRFSRSVKTGVAQAKKVPGYNLENLLDTWDMTIKDFRKRLKQTDKKVL